MQIRKSQKVVISYFSRVCNKFETKYPITELEMLAVVDSIQHFRLIYLEDTSQYIRITKPSLIVYESQILQTDSQGGF